MRNHVDNCDQKVASTEEGRGRSGGTPRENEFLKLLYKIDKKVC